MIVRFSSLLLAVAIVFLIQIRLVNAQISSDNELSELQKQAEKLRQQIQDIKNQQHSLQKAKLQKEIQLLQDSLKAMQSGDFLYENSLDQTDTSIDEIDTTSISSNLSESSQQKNTIYKVVPAIPMSAGENSSNDIQSEQPEDEFPNYNYEDGLNKSSQSQVKIVWPSQSIDNQSGVNTNVENVPEQEDDFENNSNDEDSFIKINPFNEFNVEEIQTSSTSNDINSNAFVNGDLGNSYGTTVVGSDAYYLISLSPEMQFGRIGVGLDLDLRVSNEGELRQEDWEDINDALRKIKYITYSNDSELFEVKVGQLENITLGSGDLVYEYRNNTSKDDSKTGLRIRYQTDVLKFETFTSNVSELEIVAGRLELNAMSDAKQDILRSFHLGLTYAGDFSNYANYYGRVQDSSSIAFYKQTAVARDNFSGYSFDATLRLLHLSYLELHTIADATFLDGYGSGGSFGLKLAFQDRSEEFKFDLTFQHIMQERQYETGYFGSFYEVERFSVVNEEEDLIETKTNSLYQKPSVGNKYRALLNVGFKDRFELKMNYEKGYKSANDGILNASLRIDDFLPQVNVEAGYIKKKLNSSRELGILDENTLVSAKAEFVLMKNLTFSSEFEWTFTPDEIQNNKVISYKTQQLVEPKLNFRFKF